ncbi:unnamed protein product [Owenia fusiformis]|uniref:Uncharacterized protein n=1 Tax=Owenia fusiformis TaxID=6347 RepID=A0A8J1TXI4_OWEFU|nr:unnamed protein product [Owenia fusiformis]
MQYSEPQPGTSQDFQSDEFVNDETDSEDGIIPRKIPNQNVVLRLRDREIHNAKRCTHYHVARKFHTNVFPNFTVVNVEKPPCFMRKFSPDGRFFVAFSSDQTSLEIFEFQGASAAEELLQDVTADYIPNGGDRQFQAIQIALFDKFFQKIHTTNVASNGEHLNRECSLFTDDGHYVIVGSAAYVPENPYPQFFQMYKNNESVSPNPRSPLEDYTLHLVDLRTGKLCDSREFKCDKIFLSHNQGLYLYRDTLAVLSVQQQTIHIYQVKQDGSFIDVRSIGRFCYDDDELAVSSVQQQRQQQATKGHHSSTLVKPFHEASINSLKHRLLVHLYKRAASEGTPKALRKFYQYFDQFRALRMWKMQLLDESHVMIKYASEDVVTLKISDPNSQPSFFVIYNMKSTDVVAIYENTSYDLLSVFEQFCDMFRNATLHCEAQFPCSQSSSIYARQIQQRSKQTIINAKFGGETEAVRRLLAQLPISAQSYSSSPYLDLALFSYDDRWLSLLERPKACGDHPIRFYARDSGLLKFKIHAGMASRNPSASARRLVAFTFHPFEPFAISVQRTNAEYVVNFHIRHINV